MNHAAIKRKNAVVTGGGSDIGLAAALKLAADGAKVAILDRDAARADDAVKQIEAKGGEALALTCDITLPEQVEQAFRQAGEQWGMIDILFAYAGILGSVGPMETMDVEDWARTYLRLFFSANKNPAGYLCGVSLCPNLTSV